MSVEIAVKQHWSPLSLILFPFVRLEMGNLVVVFPRQIQSITFSVNSHHITCTSVSDEELELFFCWSRAALCMPGRGWSATSSLSEDGEDFLGLTGWTAAISLWHCWSTFWISSPVLIFLITWMRGLHWPLLAGLQRPELCLPPALCFVPGGPGGLLCEKGMQILLEII